jgi:hypothetical protein
MLESTDAEYDVGVVYNAMLSAVVLSADVMPVRSMMCRVLCTGCGFVAVVFVVVVGRSSVMNVLVPVVTVVVVVCCAA